MNIQARDVALIALMSATATTGKLILSFLPNVEVVTLIFMVYTTSIGIKKTLPAAVIFSTTEVLIYGLSTWLLGYYIIWPLLIIIVHYLNKSLKSEYIYALIAGLFGLSYGLIFAAVESVFYGYMYGLTYWIRGLPYDIVHGISNFVIVLVLFEPLTKLLQRHYKY